MHATRNSNRWPQLIVALGLLFMAFSAWAAYRATTRVSKVTDREYYSHGLKYNQSLVEQRAAETMGWALAATVSGDRLEVRLSDRSGRPVTGCQGEASLLSDIIRLPLVEDAPGLYSAPLKPDLQGEIAARLELNRDGARISRRLLLNL